MMAAGEETSMTHHRHLLHTYRGGQEKKCRPLTRAKMSSCALNWLQTIILTLQNCWGPGPQSSWPKKIIVCNTLGELGPFFALVRGRFFSKAFWPGGSEFHGDLFLAPPVTHTIRLLTSHPRVPGSYSHTTNSTSISD